METRAPELEIIELESLVERDVICTWHDCAAAASWLTLCPTCNRQVPFCDSHHEQLVHAALVHGVTCTMCGTSYPAPAFELVAQWRPI